MKIERLSFVVDPSVVDAFIKAENGIWTPWLQQQPGFLSKQMAPHPGGRVEIQIFWKSEADMKKAAKKPEMKVVEAKFKATLGNTYRLVYSS